MFKNTRQGHYGHKSFNNKFPAEYRVSQCGTAYILSITAWVTPVKLKPPS